MPCSRTQCRKMGPNPKSLDSESDALPLCHRLTSPHKYYRMGLELLSIYRFTHSNIYLPDKSAKCNQILHEVSLWWPAIGFKADRMRTLVSMAIDSSLMFIMGKVAASCLIRSSFLAVTQGQPYYLA